MDSSSGAAPAGVVAADGVGVAVRRLGGCGADLVAVHAAGLHAAVWAPVATPGGGGLADAFAGVAPDGRGHGDSDPSPQGAYDWRAFAADVLAVADGCGVHRPVGVGHSGGATALLLAEQARPATFAGVYADEPVVVAADPPLGRDPDNWMGQAVRRRPDRFASAGEALAHVQRTPPWASTVVRRYVAHGVAPAADGGAADVPPRDRRGGLRDGHRPPRLRAAAHGGLSGDARLRRRVGGVRAGRRRPAAGVTELAGLGPLGPLPAPAGVARSARQALSGLA